MYISFTFTNALAHPSYIFFVIADIYRYHMNIRIEFSHRPCEQFVVDNWLVLKLYKRK